MIPLVLASLASCHTTPPPQNILVITMDTTRFDAIGAFGADAGATPTWDRLASEGARFTRAYTVTPLTIPAHSSLMTGLWPPRHGVRDNGDFFLGDDAHTMAERLHEAGYATMASVGAEVTSHHWGFAQGFDTFNDDMGGAATEQENRWRVERRGDAVVADAQKWFDQRDPTKPFFAWVHLFDAHYPYVAPAPYSRKFRSPYLAEVAYADAQIGGLIDDLRKKGELDHTWIFIMGDHGEGLGSHGEAMHGVLLYDATTHIPLIVRPPGGRAAEALDFPVSLVDVLPTVLGAANLPADPALDGIDLGPIIRGEQVPPADRTVYAESMYAFHHYGWAPQRALIDPDYKLIDSTTPEIYAKTDVRETEDLALTDAPRLTAMEKALSDKAAAMGPVASADKAHLSQDQASQLEALGYVTTGDAGADPSKAIGLPNPVDRLPVLADVDKARQALQNGDVAAAEAGLKAVRATDPGLDEPRRMLVQVLLRQNKVDEAATIAEEADSTQPSSSSKLLVANVRMQQGRPDEAITLFHDAIDIDPYLEAAWAPYLELLFVTQNPSFASELARAQGLLPNATSVVGMSGVDAASRRQFGTAQPLLEDAVARDPRQPLVHHYLGIVYLSAGDNDRAESMFQEEVGLHPPAVPSRQMLVRMYADQHRFDEQLAQLAEIEANEPPNPLTLHSIAQALYNVGRYDEAGVRVRDCMTLAPDYPGCVMLNANVLKKHGKNEEAQKGYERALALAGETPATAPEDADPRPPSVQDLGYGKPSAPPPDAPPPVDAPPVVPPAPAPH